MKKLFILLILSFVFTACTSSTESTSPGPTAQGQNNPPVGTPTPSPRLADELTKTLASSYAAWQKSVTSENTALEKDYLLGFALRNLQYIGAPEDLLTVRADFKNRQGPQSEKDFLPLAKKILEKN